MNISLLHGESCRPEATYERVWIDSEVFLDSYFIESGRVPRKGIEWRDVKRVKGVIGLSTNSTGAYKTLHELLVQRESTSTLDRP